MKIKARKIKQQFKLNNNVIFIKSICISSVCFFSFLTNIKNLHAFITPQKIFPIEFQFIVESIQEDPLFNEYQKSFHHHLKSIDQLINGLEKKYIQLIFKGEIYKLYLEKIPWSKSINVNDLKIDLEKFKDLIE